MEFNGPKGNFQVVMSFSTFNLALFVNGSLGLGMINIGVLIVCAFPLVIGEMVEMLVMSIKQDRTFFDTRKIQITFDLRERIVIT